MAARPIWKGYLKLSLVSVPVKAFSVADSQHSDIHLNQLHEECHSRIRYKKTCPVHGEVPNSEIISGYEVGKDQYVPIDPDELDAIRPQSDQSIEIDTFIPENLLDDRFLTDRIFFLVPDGKVGQKPYALIRQTLEEGQLRAIAKVVLSKRDQLVVVRPLGKLLLMTVLQHAQELKQPEAFESEVVDSTIAPSELKLTKQLVDGLTSDEWNFADYVDDYQQRLSELITAKVEGKELVKPQESESPNIINLMDALQASLKKVTGREGGTKPTDAKAESKKTFKSRTKQAGKPSESKSPISNKSKRPPRKTG